MLTKERFWVVGGEFRCDHHVEGAPQVLGPFATEAEAREVWKRFSDSPSPYEITAEKIVLPN